MNMSNIINLAKLISIIHNHSSQILVNLNSLMSELIQTELNYKSSRTYRGLKILHYNKYLKSLPLFIPSKAGNCTI